MTTADSIADPRVRVEPSSDFRAYVRSLTDCDDAPKSIKNIIREDADDSLTLYDLKWLSGRLKRTNNENHTVYLHELLADSRIRLPENPIVERNPELERRCERLRKQQMNREYRAMTKNVDSVRVRQPEETIAFQIKHLNKQLVAVGQFVMSVAAGFLFGFLGVELMVGSLDFGFRLLLGVMCALVIALAEIYFLAKKLNEDLSVSETVQLGGPTQYAEDKKNQ